MRSWSFNIGKLGNIKNKITKPVCGFGKWFCVDLFLWEVSYIWNLNYVWPFWLKPIWYPLHGCCAGKFILIVLTRAYRSSLNTIKNFFSSKVHFCHGGFSLWFQPSGGGRINSSREHVGLNTETPFFLFLKSHYTRVAMDTF